MLIAHCSSLIRTSMLRGSSAINTNTHTHTPIHMAVLAYCYARGNGGGSPAWYVYNTFVVSVQKYHVDCKYTTHDVSLVYAQ